MARLSRLGASFLVATLVAGGLAAPVHRFLHAGEAGRARAAHVAAAHHHGPEAGHGAEWAPPCETPPGPDDLACVLCKGLSAAPAAAAPARFAPPLQERHPADVAPPHGARVAGAPLNRGPPHGAA